MISASTAQRILARARRAVGTEVEVHWRVYDDPNDEIDPVTDEHTTEGTEMTSEKPITATVHFIRPGDFRVHYYAELEVNDVLVNFPESYDLDDKENLSFLINDDRYVAKPLGDKILKTYGSLFQGVPIGRMLILRLAV